MAYAQAPWRTLAQPNNALDATTIARAQSILTLDGKAGPMLPPEQAATVVAWHEQQLARERKPASILSFFKRSTP